MKFVLVHGFNVKNKGATTVDRLAPFITGAGYEVDVKVKIIVTSVRTV